MDYKVGEFPHARGLWFDKDRAESVEEELQDDPYGFCYGVGDGVGFSQSWDVHVNAVDTLESVML